MKKRGVSLIIAVTAVTIMIILISVASVVGSQAIITANFDEYISSISRVSDSVNMYYIKNNSLPVTNAVIDTSALPNELKSKLKENNDLANKLYVVDISLLEDKTIKNGNGTLNNEDIFLVAEETHNVYYLKGFKYKSVMYYGV